MIRGYSKDYAMEAGIPLSEHHFPAEPGECDATLTMKIWGKHKNLLCYFDTDEGERLLLCVWFSCVRKGRLPIRQGRGRAGLLERAEQDQGIRPEHHRLPGQAGPDAAV